MKATQRDFAGLAPRAAESARIFFFCGPDEAGAHDAAMRIVSLMPPGYAAAPTISGGGPPADSLSRPLDAGPPTGFWSADDDGPSGALRTQQPSCHGSSVAA